MQNVSTPSPLSLSCLIVDRKSFISFSSSSKAASTLVLAENSRECLFFFLLAICPNSSRLTVYTDLRVNLHFLANDYIDNNGFSNDKNVFSKNCRCQLLFTKKYWQLNYLRKLLQHSANDFSLGEFSASSRRALALGVDGIHRNQCIIMQQEFVRELGEISPSICNFGVDAA